MEARPWPGGACGGPDDLALDGQLWQEERELTEERLAGAAWRSYERDSRDAAGARRSRFVGVASGFEYGIGAGLELLEMKDGNGRVTRGIWDDLAAEVGDDAGRGRQVGANDAACRRGSVVWSDARMLEACVRSRESGAWRVDGDAGQARMRGMSESIAVREAASCAG